MNKLTLGQKLLIFAGIVLIACSIVSIVYLNMGRSVENSVINLLGAGLIIGAISEIIGFIILINEQK